MPVIPTYESELQEKPIPTQGFEAAPTAATFGATQAADQATNVAENTIYETASILQQTAKQAREVAFQTRMLEAERIMAESELEIDNEVSGLKGHDALKATEIASTKWSQRIKDVNDSLPDDQSRLAFNQHIQSRTRALYQRTYEHTAKETDQILEKEHAAYTDIAVEQIRQRPQDESTFAANLDRINRSTALYTTRKGYPPGTVEHAALLKEATSRAHLSRIQGFTTFSKDPIVAQKYLDANKTSLTEKDYDKANAEIRALKIDKTNALKQSTIERKRLSDEKSKEITLRILKGNPPTAQELERDAKVLTPSALRSAINEIDQGTPRIQRTNYNHMTQQFYAGKQFTKKEIEQEMAAGRLSLTQATKFKLELEKPYKAAKAKFMANANRLIKKGQDQLFDQDPLYEQIWTSFNARVEAAEEEARSKNENPAELFDPTNKKSLYNEINNYARTSIQMMTNRAQQLHGLASEMRYQSEHAQSPPETLVDPASPENANIPKEIGPHTDTLANWGIVRRQPLTRKPNESVKEWLARRTANGGPYQYTYNSLPAKDRQFLKLRVDEYNKRFQQLPPKKGESESDYAKRYDAFEKAQTPSPTNNPTQAPPSTLTVPKYETEPEFENEDAININEWDADL